MNKYKVTYLDDNTEEIEATSYHDIDKTWIDFRVQDENPLAGSRTVVRVRASEVQRIEIH